MNNVGFDNMLWFIGVVENIDKPTGRVQVRCFGVHPSYAEDPDFDLPWATPINGTYGNMSFIPQIAEWVFGFFVDGRDAQQPMIIGTVPGANATLPFGSEDPAENVYVKPSKEAVEKFGEPALHSSVTGEDTTETPLALAEVVKKDGIKTSDETSFDEPDAVSGGDPSYVSVIAPSYAKSYVEVSASDGNEHVSITHATGAQVQIDNAGNIKIKSMGDTFVGSEGNMGEYVVGRKDLVVEGKYTIAVNGGDCVMKIAGDLIFDAMNDVNFNVAGKMNFNVGEGINMTGARIGLHAREDNIDIYSAQKTKVYSGDAISIKTDTNVFLDGTDINVNGSKLMLSGGSTSLSGSSKLALDGGSLYLNGSETFIDGNPEMDSGNASGKADAANESDDSATPTKQDDLPARAAVAASDKQSTVLSTPKGGWSRGAVDDVIDVSNATTAASAVAGSTVVRNVATGVASALLEVIGDGESNGDYNKVFSGSKIPLPQEITTMSITTLLDWQNESVKAGSESSAAGKYQVIRKTLRTAVNSLEDLTTETIYNETTQDTIAYFLLELRGLSKYRSGQITKEEFANSIAREWAGLPLVTGPRKGQSYYEGVGSNKATISVSAVLSAIEQIDKTGGVLV